MFIFTVKLNTKSGRYRRITAQINRRLRNSCTAPVLLPSSGKAMCSAPSSSTSRWLKSSGGDRQITRLPCSRKAWMVLRRKLYKYQEVLDVKKINGMEQFRFASSQPQIRLTQRQHTLQVKQHTIRPQVAPQITGTHSRVFIVGHRHNHTAVAALLRLFGQADAVFMLRLGTVCPAVGYVYLAAEVLQLFHNINHPRSEERRV